MEIPSKWSDVTIGQYQAMTKVIAKQLTDLEQRIELANIFLGEEADHLTVPELRRETDKLNFISVLPSEKMAYGFTLDGRAFSVKVIAQSLTAGQYIDLCSLIKKPEDTITNLHKIMAVIATDGAYKGYQHNAKLFQEKLTMDKVYPASAFFLKVGQGLMKHIEAYLSKEMKWMTKEKQRLESALASPITNTGGGMSLWTGLTARVGKLGAN